MSASPPSPPGPPRDRHDSPGLLAALAERGAAELSRAALVAETALVESRLAASSLLLLVVVALAALVLTIVAWVLLMALAAVGLAALGLGPAGGLGIVLGLHLAGLLALALFARVLAGNLRFGRTLRALGRDPLAVAAKVGGAAAEAVRETGGGDARGTPDAPDAAEGPDAPAAPRC